MTGWLQLTPEQRRASLTIAEYNSGIPAKVIEKDWWVTLTLKALFQSAYANQMVFKGGTSLSKGWNLIARFSEDIDIGLAPEAFGMEYIENPSKTYVEKLKRKGCAFTSNELKAQLETQLNNLGMPSGFVLIDERPVPENRPDTDPQTLHIKYVSLYEPLEYIADEVKIEVSVRSLRAPYSSVSIQSILWSENPNGAYNEVSFDVDIVDPRKTFLEKVFLLHEEFHRPDKTKIRTERMSRHLYDLGEMIGTGVEMHALTDHDLYDHLIKHREWYIRLKFDYKTLSHSTLTFIPPAEVMKLYNEDYRKMQEQMIYRESASFEELIESLKLLQERFRRKYD